ncbi:29422_t:CDS:2, partial [Gigaspora margarita]
MGYAKKALDLAIRANKVEELIGHLKNFIEMTKNNLFNTQNNISFISVKDSLHVPNKGQQPNKYKSGDEPSKKTWLKDIINANKLVIMFQCAQILTNKKDV